MTRRILGFAVDGVAVLRHARQSRDPDPTLVAAEAEIAGAGKIVASWRADQPSLRESDLRSMRQMLRTGLNLRATANTETVKLVYDIKPDELTVVADYRADLTIQSGVDVSHHRDHLRKFIESINEADVPVTLFVDPVVDQIRAAHKLSAPAIELNSGRYCAARGATEKRVELQRIVDAARSAAKFGMRVSLGHGIDYVNIETLAEIDAIAQFNVGHALLSRSIHTGLRTATGQMLSQIDAT